MKSVLKRLGRSALGAARPAAKTALWIIRLMLPITLGIAVLDYLGVVRWIASATEPFFALFGLSGNAALVFLSAALGNIYSGIGVMATLSIGFREGTILAVMGLICHNLIIETAVQKRAGSRPWRIVALRVVMAFTAAAGMNLLLPAQMEGRMFFTAIPEAVDSWGGLFSAWFAMAWRLSLKMLVIILSLNILQAWLREFGILEIIAWPLRPAMRVFGLPLSTSFLWIICNVIGLTYGSAALIDEVERGEATPDDARLLGTHVAISHSLLEDTMLYVTIGLPLFWMLVPRLVLAIAAVWGQKLLAKAWPSSKAVSFPLGG